MGIGWVKKMRDAFGASFLGLVSLVYFTQGFRSFVWTAVSYLMKDMLKLSPSASQFLVSVAYFPWSIKPFYGILSDCFPIRGRKRVPYLIVATVLSLIPWLILGLVASLRGSSKFLTTFLTIQNIGSAMADVVIDAMIAEAVRFEHAGLAGDLQSLSWSAMAFGGICGSLFGGYALTNLNINIIFLLFSILPAMQLLSCAFIGEVPKGLKKALEPNGQNHNQIDNNFATGKSLTEPSKNSGTRKRKSSNKNGKKKTILQQSQIPEKEHSSVSASSYISLKSAVYSLCFTFRQPIILRFAHIALAIICFLDVVLVSQMHIQFGIPDKYMVLWGSALGDAINQFKLMPFLILSGRLCPPGIEGTLFALFMSINNFGSTLGSFFGAALASVLDISSENFDNLLFSIVVQLAATLLPIGFLFLIPKEATGIASS